MKELDMLFETILITQTGQLLDGDWPQLESLLGQEDDVIFDWISGRNLPSDPAMQMLLKTLTNAA